MTDIIKQIRRMREEQGMTGRDMAKRIGVRPVYISKIELGYFNPSVDLVQRMAEALDCDIRLVQR